MNKTDIVQFLGCIGVPPSSLVITQDWVRCSCPLAIWTHNHGTDKNPSFGIKCNDTGESFFNCYTCKNGDLLYLVQLLAGYGVEAPKFKLKDALQLLMNEEEGAVALNIADYGSVAEIQKYKIFPESFIESFLHAVHVPKAMNYLNSRGVGALLAQDLDLRFDTSREAVCFPIRDWEGQLVGLRGRYIDPDGGPNYHVYKHNGEHNKLAWYGENTVDMTEPVLMIESVFDYASCLRLYDNLLAPLSVGMNKDKVVRVNTAFDIVTLFDNGQGGDKARDLVSKYLPDSIIKHLYPPKDCSDPGDMTAEQLIETLGDYLPLGT